MATVPVTVPVSKNSWIDAPNLWQAIKASKITKLDELALRKGVQIGSPLVQLNSTYTTHSSPQNMHFPVLPFKTNELTWRLPLQIACKSTRMICQMINAHCKILFIPGVIVILCIFISRLIASVLLCLALVLTARPLAKQSDDATPNLAPQHVGPDLFTNPPLSSPDVYSSPAINPPSSHSTPFYREYLNPNNSLSLRSLSPHNTLQTTTLCSTIFTWKSAGHPIKPIDAFYDDVQIMTRLHMSAIEDLMKNTDLDSNSVPNSWIRPHIATATFGSDNENEIQYSPMLLRASRSSKGYELVSTWDAEGALTDKSFDTFAPLAVDRGKKESPFNLNKQDAQGSPIFATYDALDTSFSPRKVGIKFYNPAKPLGTRSFNGYTYTIYHVLDYKEDPLTILNEHGTLEQRYLITIDPQRQ